MAFNLILVRHAKSSWENLSQPDHDRPLNKRGRASAVALGKWIRQKTTNPDQVLCSSAARTQETYALMGFDDPPEIREGLYHASSDTMLRHLHGASGNTVMMLAHNPGIGDFAERLATRLPSHPRFLDYPTGATTVFEFAVDSWHDVSFGQGHVKAFAIPRELLGRS